MRPALIWDYVITVDCVRYRKKGRFLLTAATMADKRLDLKTVLNALHKAKARWYDIGIQMEVEEHVLDAIKSEFETPAACLRELVKTWLKRVNPQPASWEELVQALRSPSLREDYEKLAGELETEYCQPKGAYDT